MDTITHGIAGALIAKAVCNGDDLIAFRPMNKRRIITLSFMLGAIFPDADTFRDMLSSNELLMITWHRSITHSLLCLPFFALLLAALTQQIAKWRKWESPSFATLSLIYGAGILSHIFLDLITTFGTMVWSPLAWSRPAWDLLFIVDFTFTGILLVPQLLAWVNEDPQHAKTRALGMWLLFAPSPLVIAIIGRIVGAPISDTTVFIAVLIFSFIFLIPAFRGWGSRISMVKWNRIGLIGGCAYLALAAWAHHVALERVRIFMALSGLEPQAVGALPFPPSLWQWDGLVRTSRGVYEFRMDLTKKSPFSEKAAASPDASLPEIEYRYYPDAFPNSYIAKARELPEVQKVLWFARFPVTRFRKEGPEAIVEFSDMRFPKIRPDRPAGFTYRVRLSNSGDVISQGWVRR